MQTWWWLLRMRESAAFVYGQGHPRNAITEFGQSGAAVGVAGHIEDILEVSYARKYVFIVVVLCTGFRLFRTVWCLM